MSYTKRVWENTGEEVTYEDFNRIEQGIESNDLEISKQKDATKEGSLAKQIADIKDETQEGSLAQKIADAEEQINVLEGKFSTTNVDDSMLRNGWVNYSQVVLRKIGNKVFCHGAINGGTQEQWTVLMQVPSGYRPSYTQYFDITINNGWGYQSSKILCRIYQDGNIQIGEAIQSTFIYFDCSWEV